MLKLTDKTDSDDKTNNIDRFNLVTIYGKYITMMNIFK